MSAHSGFYRVFQAQCCDSKCCKQFCNLGYQHLNMINTIKKGVHVEYFATSAHYRLWFNVVVKNVRDLFIQVVMRGCPHFL